MSGPVTVIDHGWNELRRTLELLRHGDAYVKVGIIGESAAKADPEHQGEKGAAGQPMTNVQLAVIHEFGSPEAGIPERSFMRSTFDSHRAEYIAQLKTFVKGIYAGKVTVRNALSLLGFKAKWDQKNAILKGAGIPPPLSEATVRAKIRKAAWRKTPAPDPARSLVDTGILVRTIDHAVVLSDGKAAVGMGGAFVTKGDES
jgi:hypothetical protein